MYIVSNVSQYIPNYYWVYYSKFVLVFSSVIPNLEKHFSRIQGIRKVFGLSVSITEGGSEENLVHVEVVGRFCRAFANIDKCHHGKLPILTWNGRYAYSM
jgi:hypothetical protein